MADPAGTSGAIVPISRKRQAQDIAPHEQTRGKKPAQFSIIEIRNFVQKKIPGVQVNKMDLHLAAERKITAWGFVVEDGRLRLSVKPSMEGVPTAFAAIDDVFVTGVAFKQGLFGRQNPNGLVLNLEGLLGETTMFLISSDIFERCQLKKINESIVRVGNDDHFSDSVLPLIHTTGETIERYVLETLKWLKARPKAMNFTHKT